MASEITVLAAETQDELENRGACVEDTYCQTVKEAKARAKYFLTEAYRVASESSVQLGYAQVLVNGECRYDFFV